VAWEIIQTWAEIAKRLHLSETGTRKLFKRWGMPVAKIRGRVSVSNQMLDQLLLTISRGQADQARVWGRPLKKGFDERRRGQFGRNKRSDSGGEE
jgi:hypothetical protein